MTYSIKQRKSKIPLYRLLSLRFKFKDGSWDFSLNIKVKEGAFNQLSKVVDDDLEGTIRLKNFLDVVDRLKLTMYSEGMGFIPRDEYKERFLKELESKGLVYHSKEGKKEQNITLLSDYIAEYVTTAMNSSRMTKSTCETYNRLLKKVKYFDKRWDIRKTDQTKLKAFRLFIINDGLASTTVNLMLVRLKTILKYFNRYEFTLSSKVIESPFLEKLKESSKSWVYLTREEIDLIYNMKITDSELLKARDLLLIGCYTALRVSDWGIKPSDISEDKSKLIYRTQKTGAIVEIPLINKLKNLLERNGWMTPYLPESKINPLFKILCEQAGITRLFKSYKVFPDRTEVKTIPAWESVTSHTCRRSFATNMYLGGMPVSQIRAYTGHASDSVFMNYVQASDTEISQQVKLESLNKIFNNEE